MAIFSTSRSRRMNHKKARAIQQMIGFKLDREWFALPILAIYKVIPLGKVYGDPQETGVSLTTYERQEILVIDVAKQIFNRVAPVANTTKTGNFVETERDFIALDRQRYLLILDNLIPKTTANSSPNELSNFIGLPIDSQPTMYRVEATAFKPLPEAYLDRGNIRCVSSEIIEVPHVPPLFVLDAEKLIALLEIPTN